jgi:hypothetical protein
MAKYRPAGVGLRLFDDTAVAAADGGGVDVGVAVGGVISVIVVPGQSGLTTAFVEQ